MNLKNYRITDSDLFPLVLSKRFVRILKIINDDISEKILRLAREGVKFRDSFIDITEENDMITLLSSDKINKMIIDKDINLIDKCWTGQNRSFKKIGRFIFSMMGEEISNQDIENFVNEYKSVIRNKTLSKNFKIIQGEEIRKWYLSENYVDGGGNLKNSCMRHRYCQRFFDLYVNNPDKVKMLILLDSTKQKILGRALLWTLDGPSGAIFMDRVYFSTDFILNMFINKAIKNKWYYKLESMDNILQVVYDNKVIRLTMVVEINDKKLNGFPFVDNLGFYDPRLHTLSNDPKYFKSLGSDRYYDLCDHTGEYELRNDFDF